MIDQAKMRALAAKLRSMPKAYDVELPTAVEAADAIDLLLAEVEAAAADKRDAERWRGMVKWIVENDGPSTHDFDFTYQPSGYNGGYFCWVEFGWRHPKWEAPTEDHVNAAIDAAVAQRQGEGS